jgi:hypothetical protein
VEKAQQSKTKHMKVTWTKEVNPKGNEECYKSSPFVGTVTTAKVSPAGANAIIQQALARHDQRYGKPETRDAFTTDNALRIQTTSIMRNIEGKSHPMEVCISCVQKLDSPNSVYVLSAILMEPHQNLVMEQVKVVMKEVAREMGILVEQQQPQSRWSDDQLPQQTAANVSPVNRAIVFASIVGLVAASLVELQQRPDQALAIGNGAIRQPRERSPVIATPTATPTPNTVDKPIWLLPTPTPEPEVRRATPVEKEVRRAIPVKR